MAAHGVSVVRIGCLTRADVARLRALPPHPVHAAALDSLPRYPQGRILLAGDPDIETNKTTQSTKRGLRGYLTYHDVNPYVVQLDYLYSPYPGHRTATRLMDLFEGSNAGKTAVLMTTVAAMTFYQRRGYAINTAFMFSKNL